MKHAASVLVSCSLLLLSHAAAAQLVERDGVVFPGVTGAQDINSEAELQSYLFMGQVGVDKEGMLTVRSTAGVPARAQQEMTRAISAENERRRKQIDREMREGGLGPEKRDEVAKKFADEWRSAANGNWWVQRDNGRWQQGPLR